MHKQTSQHKKLTIKFSVKLFVQLYMNDITIYALFIFNLPERNIFLFSVQNLVPIFPTIHTILLSILSYYPTILLSNYPII